jgi:hypothetical protein
MTGASRLVTLLASVAVGLLAGDLALLAGLGFAVAAIAYTGAGIGVLLVTTWPEGVSPKRASGIETSGRRSHG